MINIVIFFILIILLNFLIKKYNLLPNFNGNDHQLLVSNDDVPLSGGLYLLIILTLVFDVNLHLIIFFIVIFLIGLAGDKNILISPLKRIILQIITVILFIHQFDLFIESTRVELMDMMLKNFYFKYLFSIFCILILINGSNFIDGLNGLLISYFLIVIFFMNNIGILDHLNFDAKDLQLLFFGILLILSLNFLGLFFLGDNGSYLIGIFLSFILISSFNSYEGIISPYYIILLIWYPCFENLFSIIRKKKIGFSPILADNKHLHQVIFLYLKKKTNLSKKYLNPSSSILINIFNFLIIYSASTQPNYTIYQILHIIIAIATYITVYLILTKKLYN